MPDANESSNPPAPEILPKFKEIKYSKNKNLILIRKVVVGLQCDSYYAYPWAHMMKECYNQQNRVYFKKFGTYTKRTDGTDIMGMIILGLFRDSLADITLEGEDRESLRRGALRIYAGVTTRGEKPEFERLNGEYIHIFPSPIPQTRSFLCETRPALEGGKKHYPGDDF